MSPKPRAALRTHLDDFVVDELPAYEASGSGEHLFVTVRKRGVNTLDVLGGFAAALGVDARASGFAGMKDRHAVATQTFSFPFPLQRAESDARAVSLPGVEVLDVRRHGNKLKPGHLLGNRFTVTLRGIDAASLDDVAARLAALASGVPNAFGPQRFGRDGDNPERALAWLGGRERGPRDRREQRLLFSALQALLFNEVLAERRARGDWDRPLAGDLVKKRDTGGLFLCTDAVADGERAARGEVSPTGPLFGAKMRPAEGEPGEVERQILARHVDAAEAFERHRALGEGTRRSLRLVPDALRVARLADDPSGLRTEFVLPKGAYATTLLGEVVTLDDLSGRPRQAPDDPPQQDDGDG